MNLSDLPVGDLFAVRPPFHVPTYQRSYAWEEEELNDFTEDLRSALKMREAGNPIQHFFGGIVSVYSTASNVYGRQYEIIDGQQRLATFGILFAKLKEANDVLSAVCLLGSEAELAELASSRAHRISEEYLTYKDEVDGKPVLMQRVVLSKPDREFYRQLLSGGKPAPQRESHVRLAQAAEIIATFISELIDSLPDTSAKLVRLDTLNKTATLDCRVVHLVTETKSEAFRLFEVLNDRGRNLSEGDLLRSHTLERLESDTHLQRKVEKIWDEILAGKPSHIERFLRAYYASYQGRRPSRRQLFDDLLSAFFPEAATPGDVAKVVQDLRRCYYIYSAIADGEWPYENSAIVAWDRNRLIILTQVLKNEISIPLLLATTSLTEAQFSEIVHIVERFVFRYINISRQHPSKLEAVLLGQAVAIHSSAAYKVNQLRAALASLQQKYVPADIFRQGLATELVYKPKAGNTVLKYALATIEQFGDWIAKGANGRPVCSDKSVIFDLSQMEIEHIYPRNAKTVDPDLEPVKHSLGNLSIWSSGENSGAANQIFEDKKKLYKKSKIALNRELSTKAQFKLQDLEARHNDLLERAVKIFSIL
jgi:hypothetical protein